MHLRICRKLIAGVLTIGLLLAGCSSSQTDPREGFTLPDALSIHYPYGRSVDVNGIVQIDSRNGVGGILPKVRVPRTFDNVMAFARGEDVELRYALDYLNLQTNQSLASPIK